MRADSNWDSALLDDFNALDPDLADGSATE